jgi:hypothetical protein
MPGLEADVPAAVRLVNSFGCWGVLIFGKGSKGSQGSEEKGDGVNNGTFGLNFENTESLAKTGLEESVLDFGEGDLSESEVEAGALGFVEAVLLLVLRSERISVECGRDILVDGLWVLRPDFRVSFLSLLFLSFALAWLLW